MAMNDKITAIRAALSALGIGRKGDKVTFENKQDTIGRVFINGECVGRFDFSRRTFVD